MPTYQQLRLDLAAALTRLLDPREAAAESVRIFEEGLGRSRAWLAAHGDEDAPEAVQRQVDEAHLRLDLLREAWLADARLSAAIGGAP